MTEKRADYRKKQQQKKIRKIFDNFKRLKKDDQSIDAVDLRILNQGRTFLQKKSVKIELIV